MTEKKFSLINKSQWPFKKKIKQNPFIISTSFGKTVTFLIVLFYLFIILIRGKVDGQGTSIGYRNNWIGL